MAVQVSYPGVYLERVPSGVRTIVGVATSITAFIGRAVRGPVNEPITIHNFGDFERRFGGLAVNYPMSYAVRDFFLNGGAQAIITRLYGEPLSSNGDEVGDGNGNGANGDNGETVNDGVARIALETEGDDPLVLAASSPGKWADHLRARVDHNVPLKQPIEQQISITGSPKGGKFKLKFGDGQTTNEIEIRNEEDEEKIPTASDIENALKQLSNNGPAIVEVTGSKPFGPFIVKYDPDRVKTGSEIEVEFEPGDLTDGDNPSIEVTSPKVPSPNPHPLPWVDALGLTSVDLFNLTVRDTRTGATETFMNLTAKESPRRVDRVLKAESQFVRVFGELHDAVPKATGDDQEDKPSGGKDSDSLGETDYVGSESDKNGLYALEGADLFNLLCIPADERGKSIPAPVYQAAMSYCVRRRAVLIVDPPAAWNSPDKARVGLGELGLSGVAARNAALYFPRIQQADPLRDGQIDTFVPCGVVAGVIARTDAQRGVWKAPAGIDAALRGTQSLSVKMTNEENGTLNPLGINCLRTFPITGHIVWGARTLRGADQLADEYKYLPVQRLALFIEESLYRGTQWVVFEPNDEPLWSQIRLNVGAFMQNLFRQGAFQGSTPRDAYFVKCDSETTPQNDIDLGIVNIVVGFAPLKPAEFVIIKIQQIAGQIET